MYGIVGSVEGRTNGIPSYTYIRGMLEDVVDECYFNYKDFKLERHHRQRIDAIFDDLLQKGLVTKEPFLERLWVGTFAICRLVKALMQDALTNGTRSWDVLLCRVLSLTLASALVARAGDATRSVAYSGKQCICYKHVTIKVATGEDGSPTFYGLIKMAFCKGMKWVLSSEFIKIAAASSLALSSAVW